MTLSHDHTAVKTLIYDHFKVMTACTTVYGHCFTLGSMCVQLKHKYDILDHFYEKFKKSNIATLCKPLAECELVTASAVWEGERWWCVG